jgi:geranylgeranyl pyrophosphate synthase
MSQVIEHLVKGEVMQLKPKSDNVLARVENYVTKSFYKTASLIAHSCQSAAILGGHDKKTQEIAFEIGKYIGLSFQIVDDLLDFTGSSQQLGKPALQDLSQGLATAPILFAAEEYPELYELMDRKFSQQGDVQRVRICVCVCVYECCLCLPLLFA